MSVIVGWQNDLCASAALLVDGKVVGAVEEERFTRVKQQEGFPAESVTWLLAQAGLAIGDVDEWAYGFFQGTNGNELLPDLCTRVARGAGDRDAVEVMVDRIASEHEKDMAIRAGGLAGAEAYGVPSELITYYEHHPAHAWSAFACAPFEDALVVTADGRGDRKSITISTAGAAGITEQEWYSSIDSLGHLYSQVTYVLGYRPNRHEGKITGLAGRGDPRVAKEFLRTLVDWEDDRIVTRPGRLFTPTDTVIPAPTLERMKAFSPEDLAAGVQSLLEELMCKLVASRLERFGQRNVALAGGVFANVQLNKRIRELPGVDAVYVMPNMGDGGLSVGAAAAAWHRRTGAVKVAVKDMFLGPDVPAEPNPALRRPSLRFETPEASSDWIAEQVAAARIVGVVRGRCEFGPRALGHRSILGAAVDAGINDVLNSRLSRTEFMPFAPIMRSEDASACLVGWSAADECASSMTMAYACTEDFASSHPAVVHVDGTARPQVVTDRSDPFMHQLLTRYKELTGQSALLNTSFNRHEEPIVLTLRDALNAFEDGSVDCVATETAAWSR
jgi:carbamoyltransferase